MAPPALAAAVVHAITEQYPDVENLRARNVTRADGVWLNIRWDGAPSVADLTKVVSGVDGVDLARVSYNREPAAGELDPLWAALDRALIHQHDAETVAEEAQTRVRQATAETHKVMRQLLEAGGQGIRADVANRTGYHPGTVSAIKRGEPYQPSKTKGMA